MTENARPSLEPVPIRTLSQRREYERELEISWPLMAHAIQEEYHDRYVEALSRLNAVLQDIVEDLGDYPTRSEVETFRDAIVYKGPVFLKEMTEPRWERRAPRQSKENTAP